MVFLISRISFRKSLSRHLRKSLRSAFHSSWIQAIVWQHILSCRTSSTSRPYGLVIRRFMQFGSSDSNKNKLNEKGMMQQTCKIGALASCPYTYCRYSQVDRLQLDESAHLCAWDADVRWGATNGSPLLHTTPRARWLACFSTCWFRGNGRFWHR